MKLADWLKGDEIAGRPVMTQAEFARRIGATPQLIVAYCNGSVWPGRDKMARIVRETGGEVGADDFLSDEARALIDRADAAAGASQ